MPEVSGIKIIDGDELMTNDEFEQFYGVGPKQEKRNAVEDEYLWPDGKIPYFIESTVRNLEKQIKDAIKEWEEPTCLQFEEVTDASLWNEFG